MENLTAQSENVSIPTNVSDRGRDLENSTVAQVLGSLCVFIMVVGIPGNSLVIVSFILNKHMKTVANFLVLNLSVVDCLFQCTMLPFHCYAFLTGLEPSLTVCCVVLVVSFWLSSSSVLSTASIAINRYFAIVLKDKYRHVTTKKVLTVTSLVVFLFPAIILPFVIEGSMAKESFENTRRCCCLILTNVYGLVMVAIFVFLPVLVMTFCYIAIVITVVKTRAKVDGLNQISQLPGNRFRDKREAHLSKMLALVYVIALVTSLPLAILNLSAISGLDVPVYVRRVCVVIVWMSTAINPLVYGLTNKMYRDAYKGLFKKLESNISAVFECNSQTIVEDFVQRE